MDAGSRLATDTASPRESQRQRHGGPALEQPALNWEAQEKYVELYILKYEVTNTLQTKRYQPNDEERVPLIKNWLGREGLQLIK